MSVGLPNPLRGWKTIEEGQATFREPGIREAIDDHDFKEPDLVMFMGEIQRKIINAGTREWCGALVALLSFLVEKMWLALVLTKSLSDLD